MDDRCVEVNGNSEALNLLRGNSAGSSSLCLVAIASSVATLDDAFKPTGPDPPCSSINVSGCRNLCSTEVHELFDAKMRSKFAGDQPMLRLADL